MAVGDVLKQILAQFATQAPQDVGDAVYAHLAPKAFEAHQENLRQKAQLSQQLQLHNMMTPYETAQVALQKRQQDRLEAAQAQEAEQSAQAEKDKAGLLALTHPELQLAHPVPSGMQMQRGQAPQAAPPDAGAGQPGAPSDPMSALFNLPQQQTRFQPSGQMPADAIQIGNQSFQRPTQRMFTPPHDSILEKLFGSEPVPMDKLSEPLIAAYERTYAKQADLEAHRTGLAQMEEQGNQMLPAVMADDPQVANVFKMRLANAKNQDSRSGSTSEMNQVLKQVGDYIMTSSPKAKEAKRQEVLSDRKSMLDYAAMLREKAKEGPEPDAADVKSAVDMSLHNPDNFDVIKATAGKNKAFMEAMGKEFLSRGIDTTKFSSQARESRDFAQIAQKEMNPLIAKIDALDAQGKLGIMASRYNAFMQGKVGRGDPDYSQLAGEVDLMRKLVAKIHLGVRGAGSPQNAEMMKRTVDEGKMDAATLKAGLHSYKTFVDLYANMGLRPYGEVQGKGPGATAPGAAPTPTHRFNPATGKIEEIH